MSEPQPIAPRTDVVPTATTEDGRPLTPAQKRFQSLVKRIEAERRTLSAWQHHAPAFREAYWEALDPLMVDLDAATRQWAFALDSTLDKTTWTAAQRTTLCELLCAAVGTLLVAGDDAELKALYDKHSEVDYDTEQRDLLLTLKAVAEEETGLDLGDDDVASEDELRERLRQAEAAAADAAPEFEPPPAKPQASTSQKRRERDAAEASRSLREIYRKLASALHPDRETDPVQRDAKTAQMQRVNQAYDNRDLLSLLQLQLDIEQIDTHHIAAASDQRLKHYNDVLSEQLEELKDEVHDVATDFCMEFQLESWPLPRPEKLTPFIERAKREVKDELFVLQCNLRMLDDVTATKRWLRGQRLRRQEPFGF
jgi:uncharacterized protein YqcC (DUF446 family)